MASVFSKSAKQRIRRTVRAVEGNSKGERFGRRDLLLHGNGSSVSGFGYTDSVSVEVALDAPTGTGSNDGVEKDISLPNTWVASPSGYNYGATIATPYKEIEITRAGAFYLDFSIDIAATSSNSSMNILIALKRLPSGGSYQGFKNAVRSEIDNLDEFGFYRHEKILIPSAVVGEKYKFVGSYTSTAGGGTDVYVNIDNVIITPV